MSRPASGPPLVIGLVGGVASGKSTVASLWLEERTGALVDADRIAARVRRRPAVRDRLARRFPRAVDRTGAVDPERLARIVFRHARERAALEAITHPPIRAAIESALARVRGAYALLDAPLLLETGLSESCAWLIYVAARARQRLARAQRRGWTEAEWRAREASQWSCRRKRARSDFVVDNSGPPENTRKEIRRVLRDIERS